MPQQWQATCHPCNAHDNHHSSRAVYEETGHICPLFCLLSNVHDGPVYAGLLSCILVGISLEFRSDLYPWCGFRIPAHVFLSIILYYYFTYPVCGVQ